MPFPPEFEVLSQLVGTRGCPWCKICRKTDWRFFSALGEPVARCGVQCTVGDEGVIGDLRSESISAHIQGLPAPVLLPATTRSVRFGFVVEFYPILM